jgi:hypothetical protein
LVAAATQINLRKQFGKLGIYAARRVPNRNSQNSPFIEDFWQGGHSGIQNQEYWTEKI